MTNVILHGALAKEFGEHHRFFIRKPIDALRALMANKKGFRKAFRTWGMEGKLYEIVCDGELIETPQQLEATGPIHTIHIAPTIIGTGNTAKIIIGAILIVISFFVPGGMTFLINFLQGAGISLVIGGVMGLLFPPPTPTFEASAEARSFLFSSLENSTVQGVVVPLGYGRLIIGSKVISSALEPSRLGTNNTSTPFTTYNLGRSEDDSIPSIVTPPQGSAGGYGGSSDWLFIPPPTYYPIIEEDGKIEFNDFNSRP